MEKNASGSVWRIEPASGARTRNWRESWPTLMAFSRKADSIVVSESWRSALTRISPGASGRNEPVLENLPAYPSRLSRDADNTIWLALFAPRSQLVEFVLSEDRYRRRMISEIDADYWVAPCLRAGRTPLEPTQQGGVKQLGVLKPWSPTWSYGLVARLDHAYRPNCQPPQSGEWAPPRRHQLPVVRRARFLLRQGRWGRRLARLRGIRVMTAAPLSETPLLAMKNVTKEYRGVAALKDIDFDLRRGEVHAIIG